MSAPRCASSKTACGFRISSLHPFFEQACKLRFDACQPLLDSIRFDLLLWLQEKARNRCSEHADESDADYHEGHGDEASLRRDGRHVPVANRRGRDDGPPERI